MADKKENELQSGTPSRLRGLNVQANSISSTLEEVSRAMLGISHPTKLEVFTDDLNNVIYEARALINEFTKNNPLLNWGMFISISVGNGYGIQIAIEYWSCNKIYFRTRYDSTKFSPWMLISLI